MEDIVKHLIKQDIKHNQLLNGLNELGLYDNEKYTLDIVGVVGTILGIHLNEYKVDYYHTTMLKVKPNCSISQINETVDEIVKILKK